ncbi:MAG: hypothetical protein NTZ50_14480 [Chloroflexi bacterium]|nr:hypothetical protein [Chloroflexota bacterium]
MRTLLYLISSIALLASIAFKTPTPTTADEQRPNETVYMDVMGDRLTRASGQIFVTDTTSCPAMGDFPTTCAVRSRPTGGGLVTTLLNTASTNVTSYDIQSNVAADDAYIYLARANGVIARRSRSAGNGTTLTYVAAKVASSSDTPDIAVDGTYVYWAENVTGLGGQPNRSSIYRTPKNGGSPQLMRSLNGTFVTKLRADGAGGVYYLATELALIVALPNVLARTFPSGSTFTNTFAAGVYVNDYTFDDAFLYWADHSAQTNGILRIKRVARNAMSGTLTVLADRGNTGAPRATSIAVDASAIYWHEYRSPSGGPIYKLPLSGGTPTAITGNVVTANDLTSDGRNLFWVVGGGGDVYQHPVGSSAVTLDLIGNASNLEVVQVIQSPANDIPLIAGKRTFVKLYGRIASSSLGLTRVNPWPNALLHGTRNGTPLPDSPLRPLNNPGIGSAATDRLNPNRHFLFELPNTWTSGNVTLRGEVNPGRALAETNYANNSASAAVNFVPNVTLCLDMVPVLTPDGAIGAYDPAYDSHFERAVSLWPISHFRTLWRGGPAHRRPDRGLYIGSGPYNFNSPDAEYADDEMSYFVGNLGESFALSRDPAGCGGLRTIRVAAVQNARRFGMSSSTWSAILFLMNWGGPPVNFPNGGVSGLAHELAHQLDRDHILCPTSGPNMPAGPDSSYPYDSCTIGPNGPNAYVPFDPITGSTLTPTMTSDYMSYSPITLWTSDYTYKALFDELQGNTARPNTQLRPQISTPMLLVGGMITQSKEQTYTTFSPALYAETTLDAAFDRIQAGTKADPSRILKVLNSADKDLFEEPINTTDLEAEGASVGTTFINLVPIFDDMAKFQILENGVVIGESLPRGPATPVITLTAPSVASARSAATDTLNVTWEASDADGDPLVFLVNYSYDDGKSWMPLGGIDSDTSISVPLANGLPGGSKAIIEVIASDGLHSSVARSITFTVPNRGPRAAILDAELNPVSSSKTYTASLGETFSFFGRGYDPEDYDLDGAQLTWQMDGPVSGSGEGRQFLFNAQKPGVYTLTLTAKDSTSKQATETVSFSVEPKQISDASTPELDGRCDDEGYASDTSGVSWKYADDSVGAARFLRAGTDLFVCFTGLSTSFYANAGLFLGGTEKHGFFISQDGNAKTLSVNTQRKGDAGIWTEDEAPQGVAATIAVDESGTTWQAEMKINAARLGGGENLAITAGHFGDTPTAAAAVWPPGADVNAPESWAGTDIVAPSTIVVYVPLVVR